jgi:hypothetical protein
LAGDQGSQAETFTVVELFHYLATCSKQYIIVRAHTHESVPVPLIFGVRSQGPTLDQPCFVKGVPKTLADFITGQAHKFLPLGSARLIKVIVTTTSDDLSATSLSLE